MPTGATRQQRDEPVIFMLCQGTSLRDPEHILEMRRDRQGRIGPVAFSSLEHLVEGCGEFQPWVAIPVSKLPGVP